MNNLVTIEELPEIEGNRLVLKSRRSRYPKPKYILNPINSTIHVTEKTIERPLYSGKLSTLSKTKDTKEIKLGITIDSFNRDSSTKNNSINKNKHSIDNKVTNSSTICTYRTNKENKNGMKINNLILARDKHEDYNNNGMNKCSSQILPIKKQSLYTLNKGETILFSPNELSINEEPGSNAISENTLKLISHLKSQVVLNKMEGKKIKKDTLNGGFHTNENSYKTEELSKDKNKDIKEKLEQKMKQNDKNKENLKLKLQRKRENQEMISVKRRIRGKLYNLLTTNTLFVCDDLVQKLDDFNKRALSTFSLKERSDDIKQSYFNFSSEKERDYVMNVERLLENIVSPQKFFEDYFTEEEIIKITQDCQYYFQDERFIKAVNMFKPKKLVERLNEEENKKVTIRESEDNNEEKDKRKDIEKYDHLYGFDRNIEEKAKESYEKRLLRMFNNQTQKLQNRLISGKDKKNKSLMNSQTLKKLGLSKSDKDLKKMFRKTKHIEDILENNNKSKSIKKIVESNKDIEKKAVIAQKNKYF